MTRLPVILSLVIVVSTFGHLSVSVGEDREGGIVGTGIVGTITEIGSFWINGQHVFYHKGMKVRSPLGTRVAESLVPGEIIAVSAENRGESWRALHIAQYLPLVGPVDTVNAGGITVLGSTVRLSAGVDRVGFSPDGEIGSGDWVAVSGLWRGNEIIGTRVELLTGQRQAAITGAFEFGADSESIRIGKTVIEGFQPLHAKPGEVLTVYGDYHGDRLRATSATRGLFVGHIGKVLMEGYLSQPGSNGIYTIFGSGIAAFTGGGAMAVSKQRGLYCTLAKGGTPIEHISELPESKRERQLFMQQNREGLIGHCQ